MGERKILNKYFPPDFDPAQIPRRKPLKNKQMTVRMMLPMNVRCGTCGGYIYKGSKFNSRKEDVFGETYLGIQVFRFYFKCTNCHAELTIKTDPKNSGYSTENGIVLNRMHLQENQRKDDVETCDVIKLLENKALDSKRQMDVVAALDELKSLKSRQLAVVSTDAALRALHQRSNEDEAKVKKTEELEDEAIIRTAFHGSNSRLIVKRIHDELEEGDDDELENGCVKRRKVSEVPNRENPSNALTKANINSIRVSTVKKPPPTVKKIQGNKTKNGLQSLCQYEGGEDYMYNSSTENLQL